MASSEPGRLGSLRVLEIPQGRTGPAATWPGGFDATSECPLVLDGERVGYTWQDTLGHWCRLAGLVPRGQHASPAAQFGELFDRLERGLSAAGLGTGDLLRTWFVLDRILLHYRDFNRVRAEVFSAWRMPHIPASTAVGAPHAGQPAITAAAIAMRPHEGGREAVPVESPLQGPAPAYGSAFCRAMKLRWPGGTRLLVSGTASIDRMGRSLYAGDTEAQIDHTLTVVRALLETNGLEWQDVTTATAYFRRPQDVWLTERLRQQGMGGALWHAHADVCRDELWFELELDARRTW